MTDPTSSALKAAGWTGGATETTPVVKAPWADRVIQSWTGFRDSDHEDNAVISRSDVITLLDEIRRLEADNARLREALEPFVSHYEKWMDEYSDDTNCSTFARVTFGDLRRARSALKNEDQ